MKWLKVRSIQMGVLLGIYMLIADALPYPIHQGLYTISLFIKDVLMWCMPLIITFFVGHAVTSFKRSAPLFIVLLFFFELLSNFSSVWYAYGCGFVSTSSLPVLEKASLEVLFEPLWRLPYHQLPKLWSADKGFIAGVIIGFTAIFSKINVLETALGTGKKIAEQILINIFSRLIPVFILGFAAQLYQTKLLNHLYQYYGLFALWLIGALLIYISFLFILSAGGDHRKIWQHIKNLLPAGGVALTSSSSLAAMPWTIQGCAKNLNNPDFAKAIIPATTNIQQIGDCIINSFLCALIYKNFYGFYPDAATWLSFSLAFVLARFATTAMIGGAIFVMLPIYEKYLSFSPEMIAIILGLNVVLDPIVTSSNVMANGALCGVFERVWIFVRRSFSFQKKMILNQTKSAE